MARGSVFKNGGSWALRYDSGIDENGRRKQPYESGFTDKQAAEARLAQCLHEVATGKHVRSSNQTFGAYARAWLDITMPGLIRESSRNTYADTVLCHLVPAFGREPLQGITANMVKKLYRDLLAKGMHPATINAVHGRLRQILNAAVADHLVGSNILVTVTPPKIEHREMAVWSPAEVTSFLTQVKSDPLYPLWRFYVMSGARCSEALALDWKHVDWERRTVHIRRQVIRDYANHALTFGPPKTGAGRRSILLDRETMDVLREHRTTQIELKLKTEAWADNDLVFARIPKRENLHGPGTPWGPDVISYHFKQAVGKTDLPLIRLHDLRHTHVTIMLDSGANVKAIARRLGHDVTMLLRTYAHVLPATEESVVAGFSAALASVANQQEIASGNR